MSTTVTYEINHISLPLDLMVSSELNLFYLFYCSIKEKDPIRRKINNEKMLFVRENSFIIILIYQKLRLVRPVQQKVKLEIIHKVFMLRGGRVVQLKAY